MRVAIMQPYFFPYIGYFQLFAAVDKFVVFDDVNFIKKGWINRNSILVNNKVFMFTIPVENASQNKLINEIKVLKDLKWQNKFFKTLVHSYNNAPYFERTYNMLKEIINFNSLYLKDWILKSFYLLKNELDINIEIVESTSKYNNSSMKGIDRIIDIAKIENADIYINPINGKELYSHNEFEKNNIKLRFIKTNDQNYKQFSNEFFENLSFIDVLMFNSKTEIINLLKNYELVT